MVKKIFIISAILLCVALVFFGIYRFAFYTPTPKNITPLEDTDIQGVGEEPATQSAKIAAITAQSVVSATLTASHTRIRYFDPITGNVEEVDLLGTNKKTLFTNNFADIGEVLWNTDASHALVQSASDRSYFVYDIDGESKNRFKNNVDVAAWSETGNRILYKYFDPHSNERSLNISDANGESWKKIATIPFRFVDFAQIPHSSFVALWNTPNGFEPTRLLRASLVGTGEPQELFSGVYGAHYKFSPDGATILLSASSQQKAENVFLATANKDGGLYQNLQIPTFIKKTVWSRDNKTVYYALPSNIPPGSILPNDYSSGEFFTQDTFWKVDVTTGKQERLIALEDITQNIDATDLFLPQAENALFFTNRIDGKLYRLEL